MSSWQQHQTADEKIQAVRKEMQDVDERLRGMREEMVEQAAQLRLLREDLDRRGCCARRRRRSCPDDDRCKVLEDRLHEVVNQMEVQRRDFKEQLAALADGAEGQAVDASKGNGPKKFDDGMSAVRQEVEGMLRATNEARDTPPLKKSMSKIEVLMGQPPVTPRLLDLGVRYTPRESVWDTMILRLTPHRRPLGGLAVGVNGW